MGLFYHVLRLAWKISLNSGTTIDRLELQTRSILLLKFRSTQFSLYNYDKQSVMKIVEGKIFLYKLFSNF